MDGYESGYERELPFRKENTTCLGSKTENILKDSSFKVDSSRKISFRVGQTHDTMLKDYAFQESISYLRFKNEPKRIL